jgi:hypothetical protein
MQNENPKPTPPKVDRGQIIGLAFELGFIIALPLVAFAFLGKYFDSKYETEPLFTLIGIAIAIISTSIWLYRKFSKLIK